MRTIWTVLAFIAVVGLIGCGSGNTDPHAGHDHAPGEHGTTEGPSDNSALTEIAVMADKKDGTEDKVVSKCAGCALGMDGKAEHTSEWNGYTFHLCSDGCKAAFEKDAKAALAKLKK